MPVGNAEPARLTQVILHGVHRGEPGSASIPRFAHAMTDEPVADLVGYLSEGTTGTAVEVSAGTAARAAQEAIPKAARE
ncbi:hypothetical protein KTN05_12460 [Paracoccus sp. Z118]|nr:hypothetical protein [Paracoccus sp. Z118]